MRLDVRAVGKRNLKKYAVLYGVTTASISTALKGINFKHLDKQAPPITGYLPPMSRGAKPRDRGLTKFQLEELASLRRGDPTAWTYTALADRLNVITGLKYKCGNVATVLKRHDPSLALLDKPKRSGVGNRRDPKYPQSCVVCDQSFLSVRKVSEVCKDELCQRVIRAAQDAERRSRKYIS